MSFNRHRKINAPEVKAPKVEVETTEPETPETEIAEVIPEGIFHEEESAAPDPKIKVQEGKKKRIETKEVNNCGIVGDTIEVRDFRAIVKKNGLQINTVLTDLIRGWNTKNYNL